jgi:hypothetical protein
MIEESRAYWMVVATLVVLVSVALWQFQSLARDEGVGQRPTIAAAPISPPPDPLVSGLAR